MIYTRLESKNRLSMEKATSMHLSRRELLKQLALSGAIIHLPLGAQTLVAQEPEARPYKSPYKLEFRHSTVSLGEGFDRKPWNSPELQSEIPHREWYSEKVRTQYGVWGPPARQYPAQPEIEMNSVEWLQERVIHVASRWIGTPYQHHHIPSWQPPEGWPWKKVAYGRNSKGIDCSNFSSFYYNYSLGIKLNTGISQQAENLKIRGPGGRGIIEAKRLAVTKYDQVLKILEPADLLYIRNNTGKLAHVVMFLGRVGQSPDQTPLVIDSTGGGHKDCNGNGIPIGVHIRPFDQNSWYAKNLSHIHRIIGSLGHARKAL